MNIAITLLDDNDEEITYTLPAKYEVCDRCDGKGVHDHEAFSNGLTQSDFAEDPDFFEDYMKGTYDVVCSECKGLRVVPAIDEDRLSDEDKAVLARYEKQQDEADRYEAISRAERCLGA